MRVKHRFTCYDCRRETTNPYSHVIDGTLKDGRMVGGHEEKLCYQCSKKRVSQLIMQERLQAWNAWAK